tara:strand:- start:1094 stop:1198 length:105 start_codon:yes stop_codon:yes gene_type:complete
MKEETREKIGYIIFCIIVLTIGFALKMLEMGKFD